MNVAETQMVGGLVRFVPVRSADLTSLLRALRQRVGSGAVRRDGTALVAPAQQLGWLLDDGETDAIGVRLDAATKRALEVRRRAAVHHVGYRDRVMRVRDGGIEVARRALARDGAKQDIQTLDSHQVVNVAAMTDRDGYGMLLFDEQGAGKTVSVIFAFDRLVSLNLIDTMVVVAPKSMVGEWAAAISAFMGDRYRVGIIEGTAAERARTIDSGADVIVMNYEAIATVSTPLIRRLRRYPDRALLVVDESFAVKNPQARRTRDLQAVRDWFGRVWLLCGTPAPNTAHDIVSQVDLVDFGATFGQVTIPKDRVAAVPVVRQALDERAIYLRNLKSDVMPDLPDKTFTRLAVQFSPVQDMLYQGALGSLIAEVEALDEEEFLKRLTTFLSRRMALLRIASNPAGVFPNYDEVPGKLVALDALTDDLVVRGGEKLVVWSCFSASIDAIAARYGNLGLVRYDGSVTGIAERREAVRRFQEDPDVHVFVGNPLAAGAGLTLHAARYAVYESFTNQAAPYLQSLDRIHRRGQTRAVEYFVLLSEGSIEPQEFDNLVRKESSARDLLGDVVPTVVTRDRFLADLRASQVVNGALA